MRKWAVESTRRSHRYRGTSVALQLEFGDNDPEAEVQADQVEACAQLMLDITPQQRSAAVLSWEKAKRLQDPSVRWTRVRGFVTATFATPLDLAWAPATPTRWVREGGRLIDPTAPDFHVSRARQAVKEDVARANWVKSAAHEAGAGFADGADLVVPRRLLKRGEQAGHNGLACIARHACADFGGAIP